MLTRVRYFIWGHNNGMKSMYVNSLACVRVKGGESECFRVDSGVRQECIMSPWVFNVYMDVVGEEEREWKLPGLLYADDLVFCGESEEDLKEMVGCFVEVCRTRGLKVNAGKIKVLVLCGKEGLECEVYIDGVHLDFRVCLRI